MEIIEEIVKWAHGQPVWQQLLVADLLSGTKIDDARIRHFADQATEEAIDGVAYLKKVGDPLAEYEYTAQAANDGVRISEIKATQNINAINDGTVLPMSKTGLNMVYGNNASGKSGYTRILKNSCNCRHNELLRGNVHAEHDRECIANIAYEVNGKEYNHQLDHNNNVNADLKTVHVFDSKSGHNYLISENDLVFMPAGMDILDSLSGAVGSVSELLKEDLRLKTNEKNDLSPSFEEYRGTKAFDLIGSLSDSKAEENLQLQKVLTLDEQEQILSLGRDVVLRQSKSPAKILEEKKNLHTRLNNLLTQLNKLKDSLVKANLDAVISSRGIALSKRKIADEASKRKFDQESFVKGTGDDLWKILWDSAREFSNKSAYPEHTFPHTNGGAKCVLCQQPIPADTAHSFEQFVEFVNDKSQSEATKAESDFQNLKSAYVQSNISNDVFENLEINFSEEDYKRISELIVATKIARQAHEGYLDIFNGTAGIEKYVDIANFEAEVTRLSADTEVLNTNIKTPVDDEEFRRLLQTDLDMLKDLKSKKALGTYEKQIIENIRVHAEKAQIQAAINLSSTFAVSTKIGDVSKRLIVDKLAESFDTELRTMFKGKMTAKLVKGKTIKGVPSSAIILSGKARDLKGDTIEKIMSEGEQRGVALAGFFAELSISPSSSAIVFDDPVTSLDHLNTERIAQRIAEESLKRQVIVFTHSVLFASELERATKDLKGGKFNSLSIEKIASPGLVRQNLPFDIMSTVQRIDHLEKQVKPITQLHENDDADYKSQTESFYKDLRKTWERAIEEILFRGAVIRYRRDVHPKQVYDIYITEDDKKILKDNMHTCSKYMHDPADETGGTETPEPEELASDLKILKDWIIDLKQRLKEAKK